MAFNAVIGSIRSFITAVTFFLYIYKATITNASNYQWFGYTLNFGPFRQCLNATDFAPKEQITPVWFVPNNSLYSLTNFIRESRLLHIVPIRTTQKDVSERLKKCMRKSPWSNIHATKHECRQVYDIHIIYVYLKPVYIRDIDIIISFYKTDEDIYVLLYQWSIFINSVLNKFSLWFDYSFFFLHKAKMIMALDCSTDIHEVGHHSIDHLSEEIKMACASVPVYGFDQTGCPSSSVMPMTSVAGNPWTCVSLVFSMFVWFFSNKKYTFYLNVSIYTVIFKTSQLLREIFIYDKFMQTENTL